MIPHGLATVATVETPKLLFPAILGIAPGFENRLPRNSLSGLGLRRKPGKSQVYLVNDGARSSDFISAAFRRLADKTSRYVPQDGADTPVCEWKRVEAVQDVLRPNETEQVARAGGTIDTEEWIGRVQKGDETA